MRDTVYKSECKMVRSKKGTLVPVTRVIRIPANKYGFERKEVPVGADNKGVSPEVQG